MQNGRRISIPVHGLGRADSRRRGLERRLVATDGVLSAVVRGTSATADLTVDPAEMDAWTLARVIARAGLRPGEPTELDAVADGAGRAWHTEGGTPRG